MLSSLFHQHHLLMFQPQLHLLHRALRRFLLRGTHRHLRLPSARLPFLRSGLLRSLCRNSRAGRCLPLCEVLLSQLRRGALPSQSRRGAPPSRSHRGALPSLFQSRSAVLVFLLHNVLLPFHSPSHRRCVLCVAALRCIRRSGPRKRTRHMIPLY